MSDLTKTLSLLIFSLLIAPLVGRILFRWYDFVIGDFIHVSPGFFMGFFPIAFVIVSWALILIYYGELNK